MVFVNDPECTHEGLIDKIATEAEQNSPQGLFWVWKIFSGIL